MEKKPQKQLFLLEPRSGAFGFGIFAAVIAFMSFLANNLPTREEIKKGADKLITKAYSKVGTIILPSKNLRL